MTDTIAIAHKDYVVRGGGEHLVEELARGLDAPIYVGQRYPENEPAADDIDIRCVADPNRVEDYLIKRGGISRQIAYMNRWRTRADVLYDFDTVILSGNEPLWWMPEDDQTVIAYTHSTPRWLYDLFPSSVQETTGVKSTLLRWVEEAQRQIYEDQTRRPDLWVANSDLVARRIQRYWNIPSDEITVVYPPVQTHDIEPGDAPTQNYYLALSRLCAAKNIDAIVETMRERDGELVVAGTGPERERLDALADDSVTFTGFVSEQRKAELLAGARGFIYAAQNEDFGMAPIEAMAAGTPVVGVRDGFTQFQIVDGENGVLYDRGEMHAALDRFEREGVAWDEDRIAAFADRFSVKSFVEGMEAAVETAEERAAIHVPWRSASGTPEATR